VKAELLTSPSAQGGQDSGLADGHSVSATSAGIDPRSIHLPDSDDEGSSIADQGDLTTDNLKNADGDVHGLGTLDSEAPNIPKVSNQY
jgi:hypothetical protein